MEMDMSSFFESIKGKFRKFELGEEQIKSLEEELNIMFGLLTDERKRTKVRDGLREFTDYLECTRSDNDIFTKMSFVTSFTDEITTVTQSMTAAFPVTFQVLCLVFQNFGIAFQRSFGAFTYPSSSSDKKRHWSQDSAETHAQAVGLETLFKTAHAYLSGIEGNTSAFEIENLQNRVPYEKGAEFLGTLKAKLESLLPQTDFESAYFAITYINIYARLALLRSIVLWQLYCLKKRFGQTSAKSIYLTIKTNEECDLDVIKLITIPVYERAVFLTLFHPSENKEFMIFLKANGIHFPISLAETELVKYRDYVIRPMSWPYWRMEMGWDVDGSIWGCREDKLASHFQFEQVLNRESDNIFYIRSQKWKEYYVYMRNNPWGFCVGVKGAPDTEGQWKVVQFEVDGQTQYVMSPLKWPCYFIYMTNSLWGQVRGTYNIKENSHRDGLWEINEC